MVKKHLIFAVVVVVLLAAAFLTFGFIGEKPTGSVVDSARGQKLSDEDPSTDVQEVSLEIIISDFKPHEFTVKKDVPVKLTITSKEIDPKFTTHGFAIKEFNINEKIAINETKVIEFTPDKTGSFVFFCSVFCGQGHVGQSGIMHVVD